MSRQVVLGLLKQGNTGNEILSILDAIVSDLSDTAADDSQPTADSIEF